MTDMPPRPRTEVELSPFVIRYWTEKGFCVHGEVAIFGTSLFIDHVAHLGPCDCPSHIVGIEMKKGANKSLKDQLFKLDTQHAVDEMYGIVITPPNPKSVERWRNSWRWNQAALMMWSPEGLKELIPYQVVKTYGKPSRKKHLLLVEENREGLAGFPSGHKDLKYRTHWSVTKDCVERVILESQEPIGSDTIFESLPPSVTPYRNKKATMNRILKALEETDRSIALVEKVGKTKFYAATGTTTAKSVVDPRFEEFFEDDE
jgi:hypothetical protein